MDVPARLLILVTWCAAVAAALPLSASAAAPPLPVIVTPDPVQARLQAQFAAQRAQAQARLAADQARVQAQLDANQARLRGELAAQQEGARAQLEGARQSMVTAGQLAALSLPMAARAQEPLWARPPGTMELITLTPRLGHYFGTDHGVLVVRAPTRGVLKLQDGDVILSIGGRVPASGSQAIRILTSYDPGEKIRLVILREHHQIDVTATMPSTPAPPGPREPPAPPGPREPPGPPGPPPRP